MRRADRRRDRAYVASREEVAAGALETRLAAANLELLRSQLQPHFLFNALNTVSTLVLKSDMPAADDAIVRISRYLRSALAPRADETVTVADELADVEQYFAIERLRFGDALGLELCITEAARGAYVPSHILQPLVENAIRHGMAPAGAVMRVKVGASIDGGRLRLRVTDPAQGGGVAVAGASTNGFGLRYVRERLQLFYGFEASVTLASSTGGTTATVEVPLVHPGKRTGA
ncbi:MAG: histidine kinase [Gemmatimonadaceae bacterium]